MLVQMWARLQATPGADVACADPVAFADSGARALAHSRFSRHQKVHGLQRNFHSEEACGVPGECARARGQHSLVPASCADSRALDAASAVLCTVPRPVVPRRARVAHAIGTAPQRRSVRACIRRHAHARQSTVGGGARAVQGTDAFKGDELLRDLHQSARVPSRLHRRAVPPDRPDTACSSQPWHAKRAPAGLAAAVAGIAPCATHGPQTLRRLGPFAAKAFGRRCYATQGIHPHFAAK